MSRIIRILLLVPVALLAIQVLQAQEATYKVIVNTSNPVSSLSKQQLSDIFLKKLSVWENGQKVVPVDQNESSPLKAKFAKEVVGKPINALKVYWQQQVFSGRGVPPIEKGSDADVISFVKGNSGAVGYVSTAADSGGVKVVMVN